MEEELDRMNQHDMKKNQKAWQYRSEDVSRQGEIDGIFGETRQNLLSRIQKTILMYD